jgi:hypothetical protein
MFQYLSNIIKTETKNQESQESQQIRHLTNLVLQQQEEINKLIHKISTLETEKANRIEVECIQETINFDVKINQFRNEFYANCIDQGLTKSEWFVKCSCAKSCGLGEMCENTHIRRLGIEGEMIELIEKAANKIMIYANKQMITMLKRYRDDLVRPNPNAPYHRASVVLQIDELSEKRYGEFWGHEPINECDRLERDKNIIKMRDTIVPAKREKIIKLIVQFIDNILSLF